MRTASAVKRAKSTVPYFLCNSSQPSTAPGTAMAERSVLRNAFQAAPVKFFDARLGRRWTAGVKRFDLAGLFHIHQSEQIAAGPAGLGFHHRGHESRGERRIHRVAACLENLDAGKRCQIMAGRNHAVPAHDDGTRCF